MMAVNMSLLRLNATIVSSGMHIMSRGEIQCTRCDYSYGMTVPRGMARLLLDTQLQIWFNPRQPAQHAAKARVTAARNLRDFTVPVEFVLVQPHAADVSWTCEVKKKKKYLCMKASPTHKSSPHMGLYIGRMMKVGGRMMKVALVSLRKTYCSCSVRD